MKPEKHNNFKAKQAAFLFENEPIFSWTNDFFSAFPDGELYMVGGAVRDTALGKKNKDIDIVARGAEPEALLQFLRHHGTASLVGARFGVFKFHPAIIDDPHCIIDIALPRTDMPADTGGYRDVKTQSNPYLPIDADLARRDFTCNALAFNIGTRALIDPYGGAADLDAHIIRAVDVPAKRFQEDYTRVLRALRFAVTLKADIEPQTWNALVLFTKRLLDERENMRLVPPEMIGAEFLKAFHTNPIRTLELWDASGALKIVMPELEALKTCEQSPDVHSEGTVWQHTMKALAVLDTEDFQKRFGVASLTMQLGVLFHDIGKPLTKSAPDPANGHIQFLGHAEKGAELIYNMRERIRFDVALADSPFHAGMDDIAWLIRNHMVTGAMRATTIEKKFIKHPCGSALQALMFCDSAATIDTHGKNGMDNYMELVENPIKRVRLAITHVNHKRVQPLVCATDFMARGIKPGPQLGRLLMQAREMELQGNHDKQAIINSLLNKGTVAKCAFKAKNQK